MLPISEQQLKQCMPNARESAIDSFLPGLNQAMGEFRINTPMRIAAFLAQIGHESGQLTAMVESTFYSSPDRLKKLFPSKFLSEKEAVPYVRDPMRCANRIYAGKNGNGGESSGDGWKYRGRGLVQLTGKANYAECGKALGIDLVSDPDLLLDPSVSARSAAWFWNRKGCNELADVGMFGAITHKINGGYNGAQDRLSLYVLSKKALGA